MFLGKGMFKNSKKKIAGIILILPLFIASCEDPTKLKGKGQSSSSLSDFYGTNRSLTYLDNPIILSGNPNKANGSFVGLPLVPNFITGNPTLTEKCFFTQSTSINNKENLVTSNDCIKVLLNDDPNTVILSSTDGSWNYEADSDEFIQVNTFFHIKKLTQEFHKTLSFTHDHVHFRGNLVIPPATPSRMGNSFYNANNFWTSELGISQTLTTFAKCNIEPMNAYFDPANNEICLGWNEEYSRHKFFMAQDPGVIYHELGHALVKVMMNQRNIEHSPTYRFKPFQSELGTLFYDEGGAINEAIADYFSYYMLGRKRIGEWAMGRFFKAARPMSESDSLHKIDVAETFDKRLSYPQFLQYDPNNPSRNFEDIHYAGQIISHYLVALTEDLKNSCSYPNAGTFSRVSLKHEIATNYVMMVLSETLAEIGDLYGRGSDFIAVNDFFNNLNSNQAYLWSHVVNPANMRRFSQTFAKNINAYLSADLCPQFSIDRSEQLLDSYGLLLFKSYKDQGQNFDGSKSYASLGSPSVFPGRTLQPLAIETNVNELNRRKSTLISKNFIDLPEDRSIAYVFDSPTVIRQMLANLTFEGANVRTTEDIADPKYNNANVDISPGEIVGVSLNLVNSSNTPMAGVQILANDFDHMKIRDTNNTYVNRAVNKMDNTRKDFIAYFDPCSLNNFPQTTEGGAAGGTNTPSQCNYITRNNEQLSLLDSVTSGGATTVYPQYLADSPQPVCFVQKRDQNQTRWVSQDEARTNFLVEDHQCLNNPLMSGNKFNPNECLIRVLPGANQAILGKIDPQKTWAETLQGDSGAAPTFNQSSILLMEINKNIPPGTIFNCRFRVRFSNCSDCYNDPSTNKEYPAYEYAGHKPFKIINFRFTVNQ